jgi:2-dehydropantoate 2-reductase
MTPRARRRQAPAGQPPHEPSARPIAVIGSGAMGTLFGGLLASAGHEVWIISREQARAATLARSGIQMTGASRRRVRVHATADRRRVPAAAAAFVFVKAYDSAAAGRVAARVLAREGIAVTLQNGLGNVEALVGALGRDRVVGGVTAHGATSLGVGRVCHAGKGPTVVAAPAGADADVAGLARLLSDSGIATEVGDDLDALIWWKLILNAGINPVAAITRLRNGDLLSVAGAARLVAAAVREAAAVAAARGLAVAPGRAVARVREVCRATAKNVNSMLQDVLHGRRTEIEAINGAIVAEAARLGLSVPVNGFLVHAVRAIEDGYARRVCANMSF